MTDQPSAPAGSDAAPAYDLPADAPEEFSSVNDALNYLTSLDEKRKSTAESAEPATAENESPEGDADPVTDPGETEEVEAEEPPIDRPKSWSKDEDAEWQSLPRTMQQKIVARELERDTGTVRSQQKAAEAAKAAEAKAVEADKARQQYEAKLPEVMQALQDANAQQYSDIRSMADVEKISNEIFRLTNAGDFIQAGQLQAYLTGWNVHQQKMASVKAELDQANWRKSQETQKESRDRKIREHSLLIERAPEYADQGKLDAAQKAAAKLFRDKGFTDNELEALGNNPFIDDHRFQLIVADALKYQAIQNAPKAVAAKPLPPVVRPGTSKPAGSDASEREQALSRKPELTQKEALELLSLQSSRPRRRA